MTLTERVTQALTPELIEAGAPNASFTCGDEIQELCDFILAALAPVLAEVDEKLWRLESLEK